ncbi:hypothetical protein ABPG72_005134 [Tetrahymena utriculariae]
MSGQTLEDRSLDISINYSGRSGNSGPSAEKATKKEPSTVQVLQTAESNNELNKSIISELSKKERLDLIKKNKQKYTFTDKKTRCQSISNTIDVANGLNEFDQWKMRIKFNQDIAQQNSIISQNEQSPEFKKIKKIVTLKKIRYPKSPTFIASPQNVFKNNTNQNQKGILYEEKSPQKLQNVENIKQYRSNQIENQKNEDLSEREDLSKLNKSEILNVNKPSRDEQPLRNIFQDPNEMKTSQKFLMRQIYQQQIRAIKSMSKVKNQLEKCKSLAQNNLSLQQQESLSPKNESIQFDLQVLQPKLMSSKRKLSSQEETNSPKKQINNNISPLNYNKYSINLQKKVNQKLSNRNDQRFSNALCKNNKNLSTSNIYVKVNEQNLLSNNKNYSQTISHGSDYQQQQLITDNSMQQLNSQTCNSQLQQIIDNQEQIHTGALNYQKIILQNAGLIKKTPNNQIKDISKTLNNASQDQINNISLISQTVSTPSRQIMKQQNLERYGTQQFLTEKNLQVQVDSNYDQSISNISPIARVNKTQLTPLSKRLQSATDQHRVFVPYNKQTNLKSYLLQDDQDQIYNNPLSKQAELSIDNSNQINLNANQNNSLLLCNLNRFQKYQKQLSSIRKKIIYDQEFYEAEIKAIDMSYKNQLEVKGKQESIKTIDKALPFTNNLIKEKIKNLLHNGSFINPLPNFRKATSSNPHQPLQKQEQTNLIQRIVKQNKSSCKNNAKCDQQIINKRKEARRTQQSYTKNEYLQDKHSFESRSPSFINHYQTKSKQSQTIFNESEIENFSQENYQQMIQTNDDSKLIGMKDQLQKYINQRNRTPLHQNFNKNKKLLYQNIQQQQRLDTV